MPHLLGLTGNIATGKTTIGRMLLELGAARYIDADAVVHGLYLPDQPVYDAVVATFGREMLTADGQIDRKQLGARVFGDPAALAELERITHPAVHLAVAEELKGLPADAVAVIDAVKLLEGGMGAACDQVWLVVCDPAEERRRLLQDRGMSAAEADARLAAQPDNAARRPRVQAVIDNSGTLDATRAQVAAAWARYRAQMSS
ncbi:MAG: dephospho-CoA kinase [Ktedonobacterales bacterium]|nr:dephospho-CoA kinase [Ktedonobacterales bacterium]